MGAAPALKTDPASQARAWFVRLLSDDISQEEFVEWMRWLDADPTHREAYDRVEGTWSLLALSMAQRPNEKELQSDNYQANESVSQWKRSQRTKPKLVWVLPSAAVILLAVSLAALSFLESNQPRVWHATTARAENMKTRLADGSEINLGAMTTLNVAFTRQTRSVELTRGEALFHVAHDRKRPFVVTTPLGAVTAVGTAFNTDVQKSAVTFTVTEGVVTLAPQAGVHVVKNAGAPLRLTVGERARLRTTPSGLVIERSIADFPPSWMSGRLEYRGERLQAVIEDVNRYSPRPILLQDESLGSLTFTGTIKTNDVLSWVLALPGAFPITVQIDQQQQVILKKKGGDPLPVIAPTTS
jgi:transmembrane sensor